MRIIVAALLIYALATKKWETYKAFATGSQKGGAQ